MDDGQLGDARRAGRQPRYPSARAVGTGGFASPSFDGYALGVDELIVGIMFLQLSVVADNDAAEAARNVTSNSHNSDRIQTCVSVRNMRTCAIFPRSTNANGDRKHPIAVACATSSGAGVRFVDQCTTFEYTFELALSVPLVV
jgi:hypothetical protein